MPETTKWLIVACILRNRDAACATRNIGHALQYGLAPVTALLVVVTTIHATVLYARPTCNVEVAATARAPYDAGVLRIRQFHVRTRTVAARAQVQCAAENLCGFGDHFDDVHNAQQCCRDTSKVVHGGRIYC